MTEKKQQIEHGKEALNKKLKIISENDKNLKQKSTFASFMKAFFTTNMIAFMTGSLAFALNDGKDATDYSLGHEPLVSSHDIYGDMTYGQAIKNAYLLDDWRHGKGGVFQGLCGMFTIIMSIALASSFASMTKDDNKKKTAEAKKLLMELEQLKNYGIDVPNLIKDLQPSITKILESLSEVDRGYFDNLSKGGLDKVNYETSVAIVSGYLKSHPKEYDKVIEIINEATLPEAIKKKYGKRKTISFAAAQEFQTKR